MNNEALKATLEVAHFGPEALLNVTSLWRLQDEKGNILQQGTLQTDRIPIGNRTELGELVLLLREIEQPAMVQLNVEVDGYENSWDLWVYPAEQDRINTGKIHITSALDEQTLSLLESGGRVLLTIKKGSLKPEKGGAVKVGFSSIFWNTAWTSNQAPHTLGILCDPAHPALSLFPTDYHSNWQWWDAMRHTQAINLNYLDPELQPIVRIIDDWFKNRPLAMMVEARVGNGKMLISGLDFETDLDQRPAARQLLQSLTTYMGGENFNPSITLQPGAIKSLLRTPSVMSEASVAYVNSQFSGFEASNMLDDDPATFWHTPWQVKNPAYPHEVQIDLGREMTIKGFTLLPRQDGISGGWISKGEFYISDDGKLWNQPVAISEFDYDEKEKQILLDKTVKTRYIRFVALKGFKDQNFASLAELKVISADSE